MIVFADITEEFYIFTTLICHCVETRYVDQLAENYYYLVNIIKTITHVCLIQVILKPLNHLPDLLRKTKTMSDCFPDVFTTLACAYIFIIFFFLLLLFYFASLFFVTFTYKLVQSVYSVYLYLYLMYQ